MSEKIRIYPWAMSVTGGWYPNELVLLRDKPVSELVHILWKSGGQIQITAIAELIAHAYIRKAAEVARALVDEYPITKVLLFEAYSTALRTLFVVDLDTLPSKPEDYPPDRIEYVQ